MKILLAIVLFFSYQGAVAEATTLDVIEGRYNPYSTCALYVSKDQEGNLYLQFVRAKEPVSPLCDGSLFILKYNGDYKDYRSVVEKTSAKMINAHQLLVERFSQKYLFELDQPWTCQPEI